MTMLVAPAMVPVTTATTASCGGGGGGGSRGSATATAATTMMTEGDCRLLTTHQGDADDREENRDAQN